MAQNDIIAFGPSDEFRVDSTGVTRGTFVGPLTGDTTGTHTGDVTGNVTGDTTGTHTGPVADSNAPSWEVFDVAFDDASPKTLLSIPADKVALIEAVAVVCHTAFDGTTPTIAVGKDADDDGYIEPAGTTAVLKGSPGGSVGFVNSERGAKLWDDTDKSDIVDLVAGGDSVIATITPDSSTAGRAKVLIRYALLDNPLV